MNQPTKTCPKCKTFKPLSEFYRNRRSKDGRAHYCKPCSHNRVREWRKENPEKSKAADRRWYVRNPGCRGPNQAEQHRVASKKWKQNNPAARSAHRKLEDAVRRGDLVRPTTCSACGKRCRPDGHHADYAKPLEVIWLCSFCHRKTHLGTLALFNNS